MKRRSIDWDDRDARALDEPRRAIIGASWSVRAKQEHLAVGAFALLTYQVAQHGGAPEVLDILARAPADEHRHAEICGRYARLYGADVPRAFTGVPKVPKHEKLPGKQRALLHVVEMCCLNETFTGIGLTEMLERATSPLTRAVIESLLEDEIDHGRVGWAHAATACAEGWGKALIASALPSILTRSIGRVVAVEGKGPKRDAQLDAHGFVDTTDAARVYREGLRDVVLPGFEHLGVDVTKAREHARAARFV